jgi:chromosome segregation ATPase
MTEEMTLSDCAYRIQALKMQLLETDYISAKLADKLAACSCSEEVNKVLSGFNSQYSDILTQRQQWRNEINELEKRMQSAESSTSSGE